MSHHCALDYTGCYLMVHNEHSMHELITAFLMIVAVCSIIRHRAIAWHTKCVKYGIWRVISMSVATQQDLHMRDALSEWRRQCHSDKLNIYNPVASLQEGAMICQKSCMYPCTPSGPVYDKHIARQIAVTLEMASVPTSLAEMQRHRIIALEMYNSLRSIITSYREYRNRFCDEFNTSPPKQMQMESFYTAMTIVWNALLKRQINLMDAIAKHKLVALWKVVVCVFKPARLVNIWKSKAEGPRRAEEARKKAEREESVKRANDDFLMYVVRVNNGTNNPMTEPDRLMN